MIRSPFTGGKVVLHSEKRTATFRKEMFEYTFLCYKCVDTQELFTTTQMDTVNTMQVYNQYRTKYGIPFPDEIRNIRKRYGLSASKMSLILGFGENQYRLYENGDMPSLTNGRILKTIQTPNVFTNFVEAAKNVLSIEEYENIILHLKEIDEGSHTCEVIKRLIFACDNRTEWNGYALPSISKLKNTILFFIQKFDGVFVTQMNKLLFYADFLLYRNRGMGLTGLTFKAAPYGPVPEHWDRVYSLLDDIEQVPIESKNGNIGFKLISSLLFDEASLTEDEVDCLNTVYTTFISTTPSAISETSHKEPAWLNNINQHARINYNYAFSLKAL